jgi:hypothetical protein
MTKRKRQSVTGGYNPLLNLRVELFCCGFSSLSFHFNAMYWNKLHQVGPFHHDMARPQVTDGEGMQVWKVAVDILNK